MLTLRLKQVPSSVPGIYPAGGRWVLGARQRWLHPDALAALLAAYAELGRQFPLSDVFRSADASLEALQRKTGVKPPGYSLHNFGLAIDVALESKPREWGMGALEAVGGRKQDLDDLMRRHAWYCHRQDGAIDSEAWHYNWLGPHADVYFARSRLASSADEAEQHLFELYGAQLAPDDIGVQAALKALKVYGGDVDGIMGPLSRQAVGVFQRAWRLPDTGLADARTRRVLAVVAAEREVVA